METHFNSIKNHLLELNYSITHEDKEDGVIVIQKLEEGINNLILGIANPILIMEQFIFKVNNENNRIFKATLGGCIIEKVNQTVIISKEN